MMRQKLKSSALLSGITLLVVLVGARVFGPAFLIAALIIGIFFNLGESRNALYSAYSVFNPQQRSILGDLRAEQFDQEMRHRGPAVNTDSNLIDLPAQPGHDLGTIARSSKYGNQPCSCGSGKKLKKCCAAAVRSTNGRQDGGDLLL
eukprot:TRINITY_DN9939_c0_g1_i2.p1 TRINITY_DN9939_c0_g1~~TRINITY_DN9939_c0_g1_i2.p1  ORF type:complete len:147 (-),score=8.17 TRINITY_DN9939_c0_g1_i2:209-649(-)